MAFSSFTVTIITKSDSPFNVIPNAPIEIRERLANGSSGNLSLIFSDSAGLNPITQVGFTANSLGQATFFAAAADYNAVYDNNGTPVTIAVDVGVTGGILDERFDRLNPATMAEWQNDLSAQAGDVVTTAEYHAGFGGGATGEIIAGTGTANGFELVAHGSLPLTFKTRIDPTHNVAEQYGVIGDDDGSGQVGSTDNTASIQRAIVAPGPGSATVFDGTRFYKHDGGIFIPQKSKVDGNNCRFAYTGSGTGRGQTTSWANGVSTGPVAGWTLGEEQASLQAQIQFINFKLNVRNKDATGVCMYGTTKSLCEGVIEGNIATIDNTRSNIGVLTRGSAEQSNFDNIIKVRNNHINRNNVIENYGVPNTQPTGNTWLAGTNIGDSATDDSSIGFDFVDSTVAKQGEGSKIYGTNIEACNIGIYFGENNDSINVDARFEIGPTATSRVLKYSTGANPPTNIVVRGSALDSANIGAVPGGIEGFAGGSNRIIDSKGSTREGGNASSFAGISPPIFATDVQTHLFKENSDTTWRTIDGDTGTGRFELMPGVPSTNNGANLRLHGPSHATQPGDFMCGPSAQVGSFIVRRGRSGDTHLEVDRNFTAGETTLLLFDITAGTLQRVSIGAADSGGAGFRVLRIPN